MEKSVLHYFRILDIDPFGYFIRLINTSNNQSLNLSTIRIRQFTNDNQPSNSNEENLLFNSYTFNYQIRVLLKSAEVVTVYSQLYSAIKTDIEPHVFIAQDVFRWLTDSHIRTEVSINQNLIHSFNNSSSLTNDIPLLFNHRQSSERRQFLTKKVLKSNQNTRFRFPYCLSIDNVVNPHYRANCNDNEDSGTRNTFYEKSTVGKHMNSYS